jgi:nitroimidazol reductase NimA-like FMN-containing flavoprotein (pyridoxamine 5'-phosphate oxidase superfamily)
MSLAMTRAEREAFLADVHVGIIGIEVPESPPLCVPIWYDFDPGIGVWVITDPDSQKGRALRAAGRFSICSQSEEPPIYRYVSVSGPVVEMRDADLERDTRPMARRYFGEQLGDQYVESSGGAGQVFVMRPERWRTVDYGKLSGS